MQKACKVILTNYIVSL